MVLPDKAVMLYDADGNPVVFNDPSIGVGPVILAGSYNDNSGLNSVLISGSNGLYVQDSVVQSLLGGTLNVNIKQFGASGIFKGQTLMVDAMPVVIASDQTTTPVQGSNLTPWSTGEGAFVVSGRTTAIVAAAKAADTMLMAMRNAVGVSAEVYITRIRLVYQVVTAFAAAAVPRVLVWQKFTAQTPTGGTARTPCRKIPTAGSGTSVTDVRDSNAALTGTAPTFGDVVDASLMPTFTVSGSSYVWDVDFTKPGSEPVQLSQGDGLALRTGPDGAFAATGTWMYSYTVQWFERQ